jgi:ABC-type polar amino acid transport system ATPase subunit
VFMDAGEIVEEASPESFFTKPSSERAMRFISQFQD